MNSFLCAEKQKICRGLWRRRMGSIRQGGYTKAAGSAE